MNPRNSDDPTCSLTLSPALFLALCLTATLSGCVREESETDSASATAQEWTASDAGTIERLDPDLDALIAPDAAIEKVADGFTFIEGPVWVSDAEPPHLLFSDIPQNKVLQYTPDIEPPVSVFLDPVMADDAETGGVGGSNGLMLDPSGKLVLCEHGNRRVARLEDDGTRSVLAERYQGKRLNSPNDIIFRTDGWAYFTDPPYGLPEQDEDPNKELDSNGVYLLGPEGEIELVANGQTRPNGIGLSPDEQTLYVANSDASQAMWMAYPVQGDRKLGEGKTFVDASSEDPGVPDGLAVDELGNVFGTGPGGVWVLSPDGRHLGTLRTAELPANAGFGDDGRTLYITARTGLYRLRLEVSGLRFR